MRNLLVKCRDGVSQLLITSEFRFKLTINLNKVLFYFFHAENVCKE